MVQPSQLLDSDFLASVATQMRTMHREHSTPLFARAYLGAAGPPWQSWDPFLSLLVRFFALPPPHQTGAAQTLLAAVTNGSTGDQLLPMLLPLLAAAMPDTSPEALLLLAPMVQSAAVSQA